MSLECCRTAQFPHQFTGKQKDCWSTPRSTSSWKTQFNKCLDRMIDGTDVNLSIHLVSQILAKWWRLSLEAGGAGGCPNGSVNVWSWQLLDLHHWDVWNMDLIPSHGVFQDTRACFIGVFLWKLVEAVWKKQMSIKFTQCSKMGFTFARGSNVLGL